MCPSFDVNPRSNQCFRVLPCISCAWMRSNLLQIGNFDWRYEILRSCTYIISRLKRRKRWLCDSKRSSRQNVEIYLIFHLPEDDENSERSRREKKVFARVAECAGRWTKKKCGTLFFFFFTIIVFIIRESPTWYMVQGTWKKRAHAEPWREDFSSFVANGDKYSFSSGE